MLTFSPISFKAKVKDFYAQGYKGRETDESIERKNPNLPQALVRRNPDPSKGKTDIKPGDIFIYQEPPFCNYEGKPFYDEKPIIGKMIEIREDSYGGCPGCDDEPSTGPNLIYKDIKDPKYSKKVFLSAKDDIYTIEEYKNEVLNPAKKEAAKAISKLKTNDITSLTLEELRKMEKAVSNYNKLNETRETIEKLSINA